MEWKIEIAIAWYVIGYISSMWGYRAWANETQSKHFFFSLLWGIYGILTWACVIGLVAAKKGWGERMFNSKFWNKKIF